MRIRRCICRRRLRNDAIAWLQVLLAGLLIRRPTNDQSLEGGYETASHRRSSTMYVYQSMPLALPCHENTFLITPLLNLDLVLAFL